MRQKLQVTEQKILGGNYKKKVLLHHAVVKHWNKSQEGIRNLHPWKYSKLQPTLTLKFDLLWTESRLETIRVPSWIKPFCDSLIWCYHVYKSRTYFSVSTDTLDSMTIFWRICRYLLVSNHLQRGNSGHPCFINWSAGIETVLENAHLFFQWYLAV